MFHYLPELESHLNSADTTSVKHLDLLIDSVKTVYVPTTKRLLPLLEHGEITCDRLWALFKLNTPVIPLPTFTIYLVFLTVPFLFSRRNSCFRLDYTLCHEDFYPRANQYRGMSPFEIGRTSLHIFNVNSLKRCYLSVSKVCKSEAPFLGTKFYSSSFRRSTVFVALLCPLHGTCFVARVGRFRKSRCLLFLAQTCGHLSINAALYFPTSIFS
ncbi:hypothetical protein BDZ45DRAFT_675916 [Acephala macrosclerotiorum]|nr:hypothetical protein BDZ45DRAFT_675916 [Acephala macrosclerotiorum]